MLCALLMSTHNICFIFLFLHENICCGYSLEATYWGTYNEYHNICFCGEIRKNTSKTKQKNLFTWSYVLFGDKRRNKWKKKKKKKKKTPVKMVWDLVKHLKGDASNGKTPAKGYPKYWDRQCIPRSDATRTDHPINGYTICNPSSNMLDTSTGLILKAPITTAADDNIFYFFYFSEKTSLDISCESSAWQMIHMKCQDLFSLKNKKKKNFLDVVCNKFCLALYRLKLIFFKL